MYSGPIGSTAQVFIYLSQGQQRVVHFDLPSAKPLSTRDIDLAMPNAFSPGLASSVLLSLSVRLNMA